jgi:SAM-dependent methyltransferase
VTRLPFTALPSVSHFEHPELAPVLHEAFLHIADGRGWRPPTIDRKCWEIAMAIRALRTHGALTPRSEILGVGAGHEATAYLLTRDCWRVFATDLYVNPGSWGHTASLQVLTEPERFFSGSWNRKRLVVEHMNALDLRFEDCSFDGIFSSSSIEHFGDLTAVRRAAEEMCRVLRHGGVCSISTEFRLAGPPGPALPDALAFTVDELRGTIVDGLDWRLVDGDELALDDDTAAVVVEFDEAVGDVVAGREAWSTYPHLVLRYGDHRWTSVHLTLIKR